MAKSTIKLKEEKIFRVENNEKSWCEFLPTGLIIKADIDNLNRISICYEKNPRIWDDPAIVARFKKAGYAPRKDERLYFADHEINRSLKPASTIDIIRARLGSGTAWHSVDTK